MSLSRRNFIRIAGGSAVILAAGAGGFAATRTPTGALAPWDRSGAYDDPRMRALSHAILAPNPHNRQPWLVDLSRPGEALLHCDRTRLLPETDPFERQIVIGLGCFLELLRIAAAEDGIAAEIEPFPDGDPGAHVDDRPVARIVFRPDPDAARDPLFAVVPLRRSNKEPYDTERPVPAQALAAMTAEATGPVSAGATGSMARVIELRELTWRAHLVEMHTPRALMESVELMRFGKAEIEANPDGIDLGGPFLEALHLAGMLDRESAADPDSAAFRQGLEMYKELMGTAMAHLWLVTPGNDRAEQIAAGRTWLRVNLRATALGLGIHPLSQALQEYPEMAELFDEAHRMLAPDGGGRVQMLARIGYGPAMGPSPRWPLETRIRRS